jgi:8-oxo-dGTP pyrophosphatase MutT (NUDIX family)
MLCVVKPRPCVCPSTTGATMADLFHNYSNICTTCYTEVMTELPSPHYTEAALCFPVRGDEVLLALKQKKLGAGFLNGFGGKKEPDDATIDDTNIRETYEEGGIWITEAQKVGEITFHNPSDDDELKRMRVHIFTATQWAGKPTPTEEMKDIRWYTIADLNYDKFLPADRLFIPLILGGKSVRGFIEYNQDWTIKTSDIEVVNGF